MAIHHDKHAYGNLEKTQGDMQESELLKMLALLNDEEEEKSDDGEQNQEQNKE